MWINSRFPDNADKGLMAIEHQLDASLDQLRLVFRAPGSRWSPSWYRYSMSTG